MVGNDIINRRDFFCKKSVSEYSKKILTGEESKYCNDRQELLKYWTVKEASYKLMVKLNRERKLNPKHFNVLFNNEKFMVCHIPSNFKFDGKLSLTKNYIHAFVWDTPENISFNVYQFLDPNMRKDLIRERLAKSCGIERDGIYKDDIEIPRYPGWDLSFSHSKPYSSWVAQKIGSSLNEYDAVYF